MAAFGFMKNQENSRPVVNADTDKSNESKQIKLIIVSLWKQRPVLESQKAQRGRANTSIALQTTSSIFSIRLHA